MQKKTDNIKSSRRNQKKPLFYLFFTVLFILVLWAIYHNSGNYKIRNIIPRPSVQRCGKNFSKEIDSTRIFVEKYVNSYLDIIKKEIGPDLRESFALAKAKNLSAKAIFSTVSEAFVGIYPSNQNELIVECSEYPVQMSIFSGIEEENSVTHLTVPYEKAIEDYNNRKAMFNISFQTNIISTLTLSSNYPKVFSFSKNSLVTLNSVCVETRGSGGETARTLYIEPLGIITGERDFSFAIEKVEELARNLVECQISHLFLTSEFFRKALIDEHLSSITKEINQSYSRAEKDPAYSYPHWRFVEDVTKLKEEAEIYGIDTSYIDNLFKYPTNQPKDGVLLWYYPDHFWFSVQWTFINTILLLIFLAPIIIERRNYKIAVLINNIWSKGIYLSLYAVLLFINGWVFYKKPEYMSFKYWIIPGVLLMACFLVKTSKTKGTKS